MIAPSRSPRRAIAGAMLAIAGGLFASEADADTPIEAGPVVDTGLRPTNVLRPKWELGLGIAALRLPDYRGSDQARLYALPLPYFVYRGKFLRADRDGARASLFVGDRLDVNLSLAASRPASSSNSARNGLPDLKATIEVGPNVNYTLAASASKGWKLDLRLPLRGATTVEWTPRFVGTTFSPNLNLDIAGAGGGWNVGVSTGPLFADRKYNAYYYNVDPQYARPGRAAYQARGGYGGWRLTTSTSRRFGKLWVGGFVRYDALQGAAFEDSPLYRSKSAVTLGLGLSWVFLTSSEQVSSDD